MLEGRVITEPGPLPIAYELQLGEPADLCL